MGTVGFTSSIPIEVILAAGKRALDLNNIFVGSSDAARMVDKAEEAGYPRNTCGWIKGLYTAAQEENLEAMIAVVQGDCSNTEALMETLQLDGLPIIPFAYPHDRDPEMLKIHMQKFMDNWQVDGVAVQAVKNELDAVRSLCAEIDRLTWQENLVRGGENHYYLVSSSDFQSDHHAYAKQLENFITAVRQRKPFVDEVRLAYIGVPPIFTDLYEVIESMGARVVFNEVQRQFSMPYKSQDIIDQYIRYTYPYGAFARLEDILEQIKLRKVDAVIHYAQTFCYRQIEDLIYRKKIDLPFLTLEGDKPGKVDARTKMRLEAFINMLRY
jgi:benzoyl-CoA reductase/2-hydroxyglutaryl-CoA dehydratase subunit BcrC/BadD/HgdB